MSDTKTTRLIAVATVENDQVAPHAGRAHCWKVYAVEAGGEPALAWTLNFTDCGSMHEWHVRDDPSRHPLHSVDVAIVGSAGEGVTRRLKAHNTELVTTDEEDSLAAVLKYLRGNLLPNPDEDCLDPAHRAQRASEYAGDS
ncbi:MAG: NifB/NifX family molybdenum-iron cluster-binding protein [Oceanobacter sp.]